MKREWEPGDVAMVMHQGVEVMATCYDTGSERGWYHGLGVTDRHFIGEVHRSIARPLVVIDAEDKHAVARLASLYSSVDHRIGHRPLQAALREFASPTPPKPDEPMGLGAVVEDADGVRHVRVFGIAKSAWLGHVEADGGERQRRYEDIAAVRVLSEGVSDA